ncbi:MAG: glutamate--cysteine ligase, partial [Pseudomonadota bacterium]
ATIRFLDVFLLHCLLSDSAADTPAEIVANSRNLRRVAERGRDPNIRLARRGEELATAEWGGELLRECEPIAAALDDAYRGSAYRDALSAAGVALANPATTPSARILHEIAQTHGSSNVRFALAQSARFRAELQALPWDAAAAARYARMAGESLAAQRAMEASDALPFELFRQQYLSQDLLSGMRL